jgi:outer membrane protein assembly factor BamB
MSTNIQKENGMEKLSRKMWMMAWLCFVVMFLVAASQILAQEWPQWRGPDRNGVVAEFSAPQTWPGSLNLKWKESVGAGYSSPVVSAGRVYLHTRQDEEEFASCFDLANGKLVWQKSHPVAFTMDSAATRHGKWPKSTPVVYGGKLFTLSINGILSCFDAETGDLKWRKEFSDKYEKTSPLYGAAMSPMVDKDLLIAHVGGHDKGALIACDVETGDIKWGWEKDGPAYASPIIVQVEGTRQIVTQTQKHCIGISADTGKLLWSIPFKTFYDENIVTPVVYKDIVIFSGRDKGTMAIRIMKQGDKWSTQQVWNNPDVSMYMSSPVVNGDRLLGFTPQRGGQFFCLDASTGSNLWFSPDHQGENAAILSAGDLLFFLTSGSELLIVKPNDKEFEEIARYNVADSPTWAHPVILGSEILVKDNSMLYLWDIGRE